MASQPSQSPAPAVTREQFMGYFRSEEGRAQLSAADCREIFLDVLTGSGDLTPALL